MVDMHTTNRDAPNSSDTRTTTTATQDEHMLCAMPRLSRAMPHAHPRTESVNVSLEHVIMLERPDIPLAQDLLLTMRKHGITPRVDVLIKLARVSSRLQLHIGPSSFLACTISRFDEEVQVAMAYAAIAFECMRRSFSALRAHTRRIIVRGDACHRRRTIECSAGLLSSVVNLPHLLQAMPTFCLGYAKCKLEEGVTKSHAEGDSSEESEYDSDSESSEEALEDAIEECGVLSHSKPSAVEAEARCPPNKCSADLLLRKALPNSEEQRCLLMEWEI
ncbi:hypothetical protein AB1Y20_004082 [Prymnesium parvum]|uniref:Uncharacterized protein n=1 Tax=Prymnesium parvum TaxID=97485 RepID=A0AB34J8T6_PRYPA